MKKRILAALLALTMAASLAACSSGESKSAEGSKTESGEQSSAEGGEASTAEESSEGAATGDVVWDAYTPYEETLTFTKCRVKPSYDQGLMNGDDINNNPYTRYTEAQINVKSELAWEADQSAYDQKVSLAIASGDIPDTMVVNRQIFKQMVQNDLIQDMTEAYEKCVSPFLKEQYATYPEVLFNDCTVDGKLMGIPGTQIYGQNFSILWLRTDYLKKVNMEIPKTMDDVWKIAKAFKDNDVSGKGNTIGLMLNEKVDGDQKENGWSGSGLSSVFFADGAYPHWWMSGEDGKAVYGTTMPEMKKTLKTLADMYAEGTIDKEFAVRKEEDRNALVASGQTGMVFGNWWPTQAIGDCMVNDPNADWTACAIFGDDGKLNVPEADPVNNILVVNKNYKNPEAIVKVLNVTNDALRGNGEAGQKEYADRTKNNPTLDWGVCSLNLQIDYYDAIGMLTDDLNNALEKDDKSLMEIKSQDVNFDIIKKARENPHGDAGTYATAMARTIGSEAILPSYNNNNIATIPSAYYGKTETMVSKWANLEKLENEMMVQIVMGEKPVEYFDEFVKQWNALGGQAITDEINAEIGK